MLVPHVEKNKVLIDISDLNKENIGYGGRCQARTLRTTVSETRLTTHSNKGMAGIYGIPFHMMDTTVIYKILRARMKTGLEGIPGVLGVRAVIHSHHEKFVP